MALEIIWPPRCLVGEIFDFRRFYVQSESGKIGDVPMYFTLNLCSKLEENNVGFLKDAVQFHCRTVT